MSVGSNEKNISLGKISKERPIHIKKTFRDEFALQPIKPAFPANLDTRKLYLDIPPIKPFPDEF